MPVQPAVQVRRPDDRSGEIFIRVSRGQCMTGGYGIRVVAVRRHGAKVSLICELTDPAPGAFVTMALTFPTDVIAVPAAALPPPGTGEIEAVTTDGRLLAKAAPI